ncbi:hypothetical protein CAJAP_11141 [Camponotus japonicus]
MSRRSITIEIQTITYYRSKMRHVLSEERERLWQHHPAYDAPYLSDWTLATSYEKKITTSCRGR